MPRVSIDTQIRDKARPVRLSQSHPWRYVARYPYAWPGGYDVAALTSDGALLCSDCVRAEYRTVAEDSRARLHSGWDVVAAVCMDTDVPSPCDNCGRELAAYVDDEN